jgi:hypothetical protein
VWRTLRKCMDPAYDARHPREVRAPHVALALSARLAAAITHARQLCILKSPVYTHYVIVLTHLRGSQSN